MPETKVKKTTTATPPKGKVIKKSSKSKKTQVEPEASSSSELKLKKVKKVSRKTTETSTTTAQPPRTPRTPKTPIDVSAYFDKHLLTPTELDALTVSQLKTLCRNRKVVGYSGKRKGDIMQLLTTPPATAGITVNA